MEDIEESVDKNTRYHMSHHYSINQENTRCHAANHYSINQTLHHTTPKHRHGIKKKEYIYTWEIPETHTITMEKGSLENKLYYPHNATEKSQTNTSESTEG